MNELQVFSYNGSQVRTVEKNGQFWWVLKDVCEILQLDSPHKVAARLDEDERNLIPLIDNLGRNQKTTVINESGLYNVILRSDKPEAKPFRKWVTSEVLPSIRKTGTYSVGSKTSKSSKALETKEYHYFDKFFKGQPVITLADFEHITGISISSVRSRLTGACELNVDYLILKYTDLVEFKIENPNISRSLKSITLLKSTGAEKLLKWFKSYAELPKCFVEVKKEDVDYTSFLKKLSRGDFITAIHVLNAVSYSSVGLQKKYSGEKNEQADMFESYQKDIDAYTLSIRRISEFLSAGFGSDF